MWYSLSQWLATGCWFSPGTPVSSNNKIDHHDITEILLKVALSILYLHVYFSIRFDLLLATHSSGFLDEGGYTGYKRTNS